MSDTSEAFHLGHGIVQVGNEVGGRMVTGVFR